MLYELECWALTGQHDYKVEGQRDYANVDRGEYIFDYIRKDKICN